MRWRLQVDVEKQALADAVAAGGSGSKAKKGKGDRAQAPAAAAPAKDKQRPQSAAAAAADGTKPAAKKGKAKKKKIADPVVSLHNCFVKLQTAQGYHYPRRFWFSIGESHVVMQPQHIRSNSTLDVPPHQKIHPAPEALLPALNPLNPALAGGDGAGGAAGGACCRRHPQTLPGRAAAGLRGGPRPAGAAAAGAAAAVARSARLAGGHMRPAAGLRGSAQQVLSVFSLLLTLLLRRFLVLHCLHCCPFLRLL